MHFCGPDLTLHRCEQESEVVAVGEVVKAAIITLDRWRSRSSSISTKLCAAASLDLRVPR